MYPCVFVAHPYSLASTTRSTSPNNPHSHDLPNILHFAFSILNSLLPMPTYDPRVDAYIAKSAPFSQPILEHIREVVHQACPEVEETLKWGMPSFEYKGLMCGVAAFKKHCTFGFWKSSLLNDPHGVLKDQEQAAMGSFGKMTSMKDLPSDKILKALIKDAMRLNDEGIKIPTATRKRGVVKNEIPEPEYLTKLLAKNKKAKENWDKFAPSHRKEYLEWITSAKRDETRDKRLAQTIAQVAEGKPQHWKYQK
jgi:uncharacterized protein YdeI (YjbR/CyaY-like superfamily)